MTDQIDPRLIAPNTRPPFLPADFVKDGMRVGLGTGSTGQVFSGAPTFGARVRHEGLRINPAVPTSTRTVKSGGCGGGRNWRVKLGSMLSPWTKRAGWT